MLARGCLHRDMRCGFDGGQDEAEALFGGQVVKLEVEGTRLEAVLRDFVKLQVPEVWGRTVLKDSMKWQVILWGVKLHQKSSCHQTGIVY